MTREICFKNFTLKHGFSNLNEVNQYINVHPTDIVAFSNKELIYSLLHGAHRIEMCSKGYYFALLFVKDEL